MTQVPYTLHDGPLAGQAVIISATRGGAFPQVIYPHAPLPVGHAGEPIGRHQYVFSSTLGEYLHSAACACQSGVHDILPDPVDTPSGRGYSERIRERQSRRTPR